MAILIAYPETVQFRDVVTHVNRHMGYSFGDQPKQLPNLRFIGTVKLHGTNAAIVYQQSIGHWCQSRNRVLSIFNDNADFAKHMDSLAENFFTDHVLSHCSAIRQYYEQGSTILIFGEWCGDKIQGDANVAITGLPKMFVIFKIKIISRKKVSNRSGVSAQEKYKDSPNGFWLDPKEWTNIKWPSRSIYNIYDFPSYDIEIDFNAPHLSQNTLTTMTEAIEQQCPVGAHFGQIGCGEGIVWTEWQQTHGCLTFKVKGREHMIINSKTLVPIHTPKLNSVQEFVEYSCTKNRMQQAYNCIQEEMPSIQAKDFSTFVRWLAEDIIKEEKDTMDAVHIDAKDVTRVITSTAQAWFSNRLVQDRKVKSRK